MGLRGWYIFCLVVVLLRCASAQPPPQSNAKQGGGEELSFIRDKSCISVSKDVDCGGDIGIFYRLNGGGWNTVQDPSKELPLSVPPNGQLFLTVCNISNHEVDSDTTITETLLPTLVRGVGPGGSIAVFVMNSANIKVKKSVRIEQYTSWRLAILDTVVQGPVGRGASVYVAIRNSGNVFLKDGAQGIELINGHLVAPPVHVDDSCTPEACIQVEVSDSANVMGRQGGQGVVRFGAGASLLQGGINTTCLEDSTKYAYIRRSANVQGVRAVAGDRAELLHSVIETGQTRSTEIAARVINSGNVEAKIEAHLSNARLIFSLVLVQSGIETTILVGSKNIGNMRTSRYLAQSGGTIGDIVQISGNTRQVHVAVMAINVGNIDVTGPIRLEQHEACIKSLLRVDGTTTKTRAQVAMKASCNVRGAELTMKDGSTLIQSTITIARTLRMLLSTKLERSGNTYITGLVALHDSALVKSIVSVGTISHSILVLGISRRSGNLECGRSGSQSFVNDGSYLVKHAIHLEAIKQGAEVKLGVQLQVLGNAFAKLSDSRQLIGKMFHSPRGVDKIHLHQDYVGKELNCGA